MATLDGETLAPPLAHALNNQLNGVNMHAGLAELYVHRGWSDKALAAIAASVQSAEACARILQDFAAATVAHAAEEPRVISVDALCRQLQSTHVSTRLTIEEGADLELRLDLPLALAALDPLLANAAEFGADTLHVHARTVDDRV